MHFKGLAETFNHGFVRVQPKLVSKTEEFLDREAGNAAFFPVVSSPPIRSGGKDRPIALAIAFLTSGVSAGVLLAWFFQNNILAGLLPNGVELKPGVELALTVASFSLLVAGAFLLIEKWRKIAERQLICANMPGSDEALQVVVRKMAGTSELATAVNSAQYVFEKAALLKAAIDEHGGVLLEALPQQEDRMQKIVCLCSSGGRKFRILRKDGAGRRTLILTSPTKRRRGAN